MLMLSFVIHLYFDIQHIIQNQEVRHPREQLLVESQEELPDLDDHLQLADVEGDVPHNKHLSRCLAAWRDSEEDIGSLSCMIPDCGFLTLQVIGITMVEGVPSGQIVVHDGHCFVSAKVDPRYLVELKKRNWGMYSLIQIRATSGLHTDLILVSIMIHL